MGNNELFNLSTDELQVLYSVLGSGHLDDVLEIAQSLFIAIKNDPEFKNYDNARLALFVRRMVEQLISDLGGLRVYIGTGQSSRLSQRDIDIWNQFNGSNYDKLAKAYNLSGNRIRQIVERMRREYIQRNQGLLDFSAEDTQN